MLNINLSGQQALTINRWVGVHWIPLHAFPGRELAHPSYDEEVKKWSKQIQKRCF